MNSWRRSRQLNGFRFICFSRKENFAKFVSQDNDDNDNDQENESKTEKSFQDSKAMLECRGECGSNIMDFFLNQTNLKILQKNSPPRYHDILFGRASKEYFEKLLFDSKAQEEEFCDLFVSFLKTNAKKTRMGMNKRA